MVLPAFLGKADGHDRKRVLGTSKAVIEDTPNMSYIEKEFGVRWCRQKSENSLLNSSVQGL